MFCPQGLLAWVPGVTHGVSLSLVLELQEREAGVVVEVRAELKLAIAPLLQLYSWNPPKAVLRLRTRHGINPSIRLRVTG